MALGVLIIVGLTGCYARPGTPKDVVLESP
jgi:hypothetical protein